MTFVGAIHKQDCVQAMRELKPKSVDLVFADPPFNIGFDYDTYDDKKDTPTYLRWSREWISGVHRVLKPTGAFWLAIGDEYAAELKVESQKIGFHCRSWVIWYYTFGVNCKLKFSRSHAHMFHFVKDPNSFTFNREDILIPSARQLVYADKRAAAGRLPDDTWILRPQDLTDGFNPDEDVWYFPRVAGTFKEREGFHGCQMPEQLLGRIIKVSSNPGELVLDPFSGSATTLAVAKKLGRQFIGFDISDEYIERGLRRLESIEPGDPLDGSAEPKASAPGTPSYTKKATAAVQLGKPASKVKAELSVESDDLSMREAIEQGIVDAFRQSSDGYSADRVVADPRLNDAFLEACQKLSLPGTPSLLNKSLFGLRKAGKLTPFVPTDRRTELRWSQTDPYLFASEIAWRKLSDLTGASLDDILCNPSQARRFDEIASQFAPGYSAFEYRWAALKLRKEAKTASNRSEQFTRLAISASLPFDELNLSEMSGVSGLYLVTDSQQQPLYAGETLNLEERLNGQFGREATGSGWSEFEDTLRLSLLPYSRLPHSNLELGPDPLTRWLVAYQLSLVRQTSPLLNRLGTT